MEKKVESISEADKNTLGMASLSCQITKANAEAAIAKHETSEVTYKYVVAQLYIKYGLTKGDTITENGDIIKKYTAEEVENEVR